MPMQPIFLLDYKFVDSYQPQYIRHHSIIVSNSKAKFAGNCSSEQTGYNVLR